MRTNKTEAIRGALEVAAAEVGTSLHDLVWEAPDIALRAMLTVFDGDKQGLSAEIVNRLIPHPYEDKN